MKIRIDKDGLLQLERAGKMASQSCPHQQGTIKHAIACGDWCPLFTEPQKYRDDAFDDKPMTVSLVLCKNIWEVAIEDFTDERKP